MAGRIFPEPHALKKAIVTIRLRDSYIKLIATLHHINPFKVAATSPLQRFRNILSTAGNR
jgi:hypothetical protein